MRNKSQRKPGARAMCYTTFTYDAPVAVEFRIAEWREIGEDYTLYEEKQYTAKEAAESATLYEEVWTDLPESVAQSGEVTPSPSKESTGKSGEYFRPFVL